MIGNAAILEDAIGKLEDLPGKLDAFMEQLMQNSYFTDWLIAFNQDKMFEGKRPDGTDIEKVPTALERSTKYEEMTKHIKAGKAQPYDRVTLKDKGDFYKEVKVKVTNKAAVLYDNDPKADDLIGIWGHVLGVSDDDLQNFIEIIKPEFYIFANKYFS